MIRGERIYPRSFEIPAVPVPRRLGASAAERIQPDAATNPLAFLMTPDCAQGAPRKHISLFHAGGREAEVEEVFRRILAGGLPLDQVEIVCASDDHAALVWEKALRNQWPVTLGTGIPAALTRPGRALLGFCDWIETDFSAGHFRRLLQSGDLGVHKENGFTPTQAARLLVRTKAGWGRATYRIAFGTLEQHFQTRAKQGATEEDRAYAETQAELTRRVGDWIERLVASVPKPDLAGQVPFQTVVKAVLDFLENTSARSTALEHRATAVLRDHIGELRALEDFTCGLTDSLRFIRERVQSVRVAAERNRPGHLYACGLTQCGYAGRKHLFLIGLEEGRVFSSSTEDAVLLDAERRGISPDLPLSSDGVDEAVYALLARLAATSADITFSYSCRDTREFRETYASWIMLQAYRLKIGGGTASYRDLKAALGEPKSAVPNDRDLAVTSSEWWLRSVVGTEEEGATTVCSTFDSVAHGVEAEARRQSSQFTAFDGAVPNAGPVLDPCAPGASYSVTELESAAQCPFRFFLKRGLGVRPVDAGERDKDVWLDPLTRGSELHELYASLLRRCRDESRSPRPEDGVWLISKAKARLEKLNEEMPAATAEVRDRESKEFLADVQLFVDAECSGSPSVPIGLEVSFGRPLEEDDKEPLARAEAVEVDLGQGLTFRIAGRIDRIDQVGDCSFEVLDYKTGGYWRDDWLGVFQGGSRLQHALYGLAAVELLKSQHQNPNIVAGVYYFSSHKGRQERVSIPAPARTAISAVLGDLRDVIIKGTFVRTGEESNCRFCDYIAACGGETVRQASDKLADSALEAYKRLKAHD